MIQSSMNQSSESMIVPVEDRKSVLSGIARAAAEAVVRKRAERIKLSNQAYLEKALERLDRIESASTPALMSNKRLDMSGRLVCRFSWLDIIETEEEARDDVKHYQRALGLLVEPVPVVQPVAVPVAVTVPMPVVQSTPRSMPVPIAAAECRTTFCSLSVRQMPADVIVADLYQLCPSASDVFINRHRDMPTYTNGKPLRKSSHRGDNPGMTQKGAFVSFRTPAEAARALAALQGVRLTCSYTGRVHTLLVEPARQDRGGRR